MIRKNKEKDPPRNTQNTTNKYRKVAVSSEDSGKGSKQEMCCHRDFKTVTKQKKLEQTIRWEAMPLFKSDR